MDSIDSVRSDGNAMERGLHEYRLAISARNDRPAKDINFLAADAHEALVIAHREASDRPAELWRDGKKLCHLAEASDSVWLVSPVTQS